MLSLTGTLHGQFAVCLVLLVHSKNSTMNADLIVSLDAVNFSFPKYASRLNFAFLHKSSLLLSSREDLPKNTPWPHQDQDPLKSGFRCLQGLVNLFPNGPEDGGLIVCRGAQMLSEEFHEEFIDEPRIPAWTREWYGFTDAGMK